MIAAVGCRGHLGAPGRSIEPARGRSRAREYRRRLVVNGGTRARRQRLSQTRRGPMSSCDIDVTRDGGCWTVHIREVHGPAQGRTISEAEWTARQMIALATGVPIDDIAVRSAGLAALKTAFRPGGRAARRPGASSAPGLSEAST